LAVFKGAVLVLLALAVHLSMSSGAWVALAVWLVGLPLLFRPGVAATTILVLINWGVNMALAAVLAVLNLVPKNY
jgi:hypothetical protein